MAPKEISRISMPSREDFFQDYVFKHRPVVITDLFERQEIANITTIEEAASAWGAMKIQLQEEYTTAEGKPESPKPTFVPLREYIDFTRSNRSSRLCCTEYETPARVLASFRLPSVCTVASGPENEIFDLPKKYGQFDLATAIFVANQGNVAHLHFDGDQREVFLHQVYGRKRVVLFQPASGIHLRTLDGPYTRPSLSGVYLEHMSLAEKLSFIELADGYHTVLEPGETIYIPMLMWHHLEYLNDAMSFSIRFGRTRYGRFLSLDNFHRDPYIQNVASKLVGPEDVLSAFSPIIDAIKTAYKNPAPDSREKIREMRTLFRGLCEQLCPEALPERLCPPKREEEQVVRIAEGKDMKGWFKYADPILIAKTRPVGPITSEQKEMIRDGFRRSGYPNDVAQAVIFNRVGRVDLDALTKAEAAQMIAYLRTPGAAW